MLALRTRLIAFALVLTLAGVAALVLLPKLERTVAQFERIAHSPHGLAGGLAQQLLTTTSTTPRRPAHAPARRAAHAPIARPAGTAAARPAGGAARRTTVPGRAPVERPAAGGRPRAAAGSPVGWRPVLAALLVGLAIVLVCGAASGVSRLWGWRRRVYWRYRVLPNGHDRPSAEQVVRAIGTNGAIVAEQVSSRLWRGQPVFGVQLDYDPSGGGRLVPWLVCERRHAHALDGALQQAYRNVRVELDAGVPMVASDGWCPGWVLRLRKSRDPIYPLFSSPQAIGLGPPLNSVGVMLHSLCRPLEGRAGSRGSVRIMVRPSDRTAAYLRERHRRAEKRTRLSAQLERGQGAPQSSVDAQQARQSAQMAEHAMFHVEVQIAASDFQACKSLSGALLDYPGLNTLKRRQMELRNRLYRRRWASFTPPVWMRGSRKLMSAAELAYLIRLPSQALSVPLARSREPRLPANGGTRRRELGATIRPSPNGRAARRPMIVEEAE